MPPIIFRAEVNYVEVDAVVRDAAGAFVRDLKPGEFEVLEDGVPQSVSAFSLVDIPVVRADRALFLPQELDPDVRSNAGGPDGRLYVLLLDDVHTSFTRTARVREAAKRFIERHLGSNDVTAVIYTSGRSDAAQEFTSSRRLLEQSVDKFTGRKIRSAFLEKMDAYNRRRGTGLPASIADPAEAERLYQARAMLSTVKNLCDYLADIRGRRKAVILIGEGIDYDILGGWSAGGSSSSSGSGSGDQSSSASGPQSISATDRRGDGTLVLSESQDAIAAATRANVSIYAIDPRGLYNPGEDLITMSGAPPDDPAYGIRITDLDDELRRSQDSLRTLAEETGGFASLSSNDFVPAFERIVDENSSYYVLGYYPTNDRRDGRFRRIEVRVLRPGLTVKARRGYAAPSGKPSKDRTVEAFAGTSKELRETLNNPVQVSDLRFAVFAAPLMGTGKKSTVALVTQFLGRDFAFKQDGTQRSNALEMSYVAIDKGGKVAGGNRERVDMSLKPDTYDRVLKAGFRVQSRLELLPGTYQLRVAAREGGGRTGSVHYDLLVPDFGENALNMSGLVLTSKAAGSVPTIGSVPELAKVLPAPPTTARVFAPDDELVVLAEVYDSETRHSHSVDITTSLKAEGAAATFSTTETRSSKELGGSRGVFGHMARIPLNGIAEGLYVLRVEARPTLKGMGGVVREVQVRIGR